MVVTAGLTVVVTVREVSLSDGPTELAPPAQVGRHQAGTVPRLPSLAAAGGGGGGGGGGGEEAGLVRMTGLPIISYLEHNNNTPLSPHHTAGSTRLNRESFLSSQPQPGGRRNYKAQWRFLSLY